MIVGELAGLTLEKTACYSSVVPSFASCGIHVVQFLNPARGVLVPRAWRPYVFLA